MKFFYRFFYWFVPWWYGFTMQMTRKRRYPEMPRFKHTEHIIWELDYGRRWRKDPGKRGNLDVLSHPRKVQSRIDEGKVGIGDCDDHAIYWATALLENNLAQRVYLGTIWAKRPSERKGFGHVVCVWEDRVGDTYWADYREPGRTVGPWGFAFDYVRRSGALVHAAGLIEVKLRKSGQPKLCKKVKRIIL